MEQGRRGTLVLAVFLIGMGILLLALNLIPGWNVNLSWPIIFFVLAAGCLIPPLVFPKLRTGLAALFIPGMILLAMGVIFVYNVVSKDWDAWAYAWLLISSSTGAGLALASWYGEWGKPVTLAGLWIMITGGIIFAIFAFIFGEPLIKTIAAVLLILFGLLLVVRAAGDR